MSFFFKKIQIFCLLILLVPLKGVAQNSIKGSNNSYNLPQGIKLHEYLPNTIVLKFKQQSSVDKYRIVFLNSIKRKFSDAIDLDYLRPKFPLKEEFFYKRQDDVTIALSRIFELKYSGNIGVEAMINHILSLGLVEYAEPVFVPEFCFTPDDPTVGSQNFLSIIKAYDAWDISKGDTNVVVGIIDTGVDWDHPDISANIKNNFADPINAIDDDNNGYIDDFRGWDFGSNDNDPMNEVGIDHGSAVAGCAGAVTNNGIGVASPGFNCKILPIKVVSSTGLLIGPYDAMKYAADMGASIINCSFGSPYDSQFQQEIIEYVTKTKDVLIVSAAGNKNQELKDYYPASYLNVFAVANTNDLDVKYASSNYGSKIDICAPGVNIYSTYFNDSYKSNTGTSLSSPIVAGCAALVKSHFPHYSREQIAEQLRTTADTIDYLNPTFKGMLGAGRINIFRALSEPLPTLIQEDKIVLYPNPASKYINIKVPHTVGKTMQLSIYSSLGTIVYSITYKYSNDNIVLDIESLSNGLFFYRIVTENKEYSGKFFVKQE